MGNSHSGELVSSIAALRTTPVPEGAASEAYWLQVFPAAAFSPTDLFSVLSPEAVREMRDVQPRNLALAVRKVGWCAGARCFCSPTAQLVPQAVEIMDTCVTTPKPDTFPRVLNAVRTLTRMLPILFEESDTEGSEFIERLFWCGPVCYGVDVPSCHFLPAPSLAGTRKCHAARPQPVQRPPRALLLPQPPPQLLLLPQSQQPLLRCLRLPQQQQQRKAPLRLLRLRPRPPQRRRPRRPRPCGRPSPTRTCSTRWARASAMRP